METRGFSRSEKVWMGLGFAWGLFWLAAAISLFPGFARGEEIKGEFVIKDYAVGEFAVKGPIEDQVIKVAKEIKEKIGDKTGHLRIVLIGSADTTGTGPKNDKLAKERAEEVAATLSADFPPGTEIIPRSRGDAENVRQVRGEWTFILKPEIAPAPTAVTPPSEKSNLIFWSVALAILVIVAIIFFRTATRRLEKKTIAPAKDSEVSIIEYFPYSMDGVNYSVRVERKGNLYILPFPMFSNPAVLQTKKDRDDVGKAIHWYFKNWKKGKEPFAKEVNRLMKEEVIIKN